LVFAFQLLLHFFLFSLQALHGGSDFFQTLFTVFFLGYVVVYRLDGTMDAV
jgi:hypothetical protein